MLTKEQTIDIEALWETNTAKSREMVKSRKEIQMKIASLAMEVCEITHGGGRKDIYTIKRFAKEVGINQSTLSNWLSVKRMVFDKMPKNISAQATYAQLLDVARVIDSNATRQEVVKKYEENKSQDSGAKAVIYQTKHLRSLDYNIVQKKYADNGAEEILQECLFYCKRIVDAIKNSGRNIKPINNGITSKYKMRFTVNGAFGKKHKLNLKNFYIGDIKITEKDQKIINYIKRNKKFHSPTEVGMKLGLHNASSASAWAYKTLNKLQSLDLVERNKFGHYKWSYKN